MAGYCLLNSIISSTQVKIALWDQPRRTSLNEYVIIEFLYCVEINIKYKNI